MTKDNFLTKRWHNILSVGLGIPLVVFITVVLSSSFFSEFVSFMGIVITGAVY